MQASANVIRNAIMISQDQKGELLSTMIVTCRGGNDGLRFKCLQGHEFKISVARLIAGDVKPLNYEDWCLKCRNFHKKAIAKIEETHYELLSNKQVISEIIVKCHNDHLFQLTSNEENVLNVSEICQTCYVEAEEKRKALIQEQAIKEEKEAKERQRKLFEESAKIYREEQEQSQNFGDTQSVNNYEVQIAQICFMAKKKTESMIQVKEYANLTHSEIYNVLKILYMPADILAASF